MDLNYVIEKVCISLKSQMLTKLVCIWKLSKFTWELRGHGKVIVRAPDLKKYLWNVAQKGELVA